MTADLDWVLAFGSGFSFGLSLVELSVLGRSHAMSFLEVANEMAVVVDAQSGSDLGHSYMRIFEHPRGPVHLQFFDVLGWREADLGFEEGAQS